MSERRPVAGEAADWIVYGPLDGPVDQVEVED